MTLTEQWKKGELPYGNYYVKNIYGNVVNDIYRDNKYDEWMLHSDREICEVLAPVPSYEEWKSLNEILDSSLQTNKALAHRLNLCKELLKECMTMFVKMYETNTVNSVFLGLYENIKTKIDNAIGEKK